jgi:hypothetical protein
MEPLEKLQNPLLIMDSFSQKIALDVKIKAGSVQRAYVAALE